MKKPPLPNLPVRPRMEQRKLHGAALTHGPRGKFAAARAHSKHRDRLVNHRINVNAAMAHQEHGESIDRKWRTAHKTANIAMNVSPTKLGPGGMAATRETLRMREALRQQRKADGGRKAEARRLRVETKLQRLQGPGEWDAW